MRALLSFTLVVLVAVTMGCRRKRVRPASETGASSDATTTAAADPSQRPSVAPGSATASLAAVDAALSRYVEKHGEFPARLNDLVAAGYLSHIPAPPPGKILKYDPNQKYVAFVDASN